MTAVQSVLQGSPEAGEALMALMSECCDLREFGREVLRLAVNSLMSAEADSLCGAAWGQRSEGRSNSRNGYRARSLKTPWATWSWTSPSSGGAPTTRSRCCRGGRAWRPAWPRWWWRPTSTACRPGTCRCWPRVWGVLAVGLRGLQAHLRARRPGGGAALAGPLLSEHQQGGSSPAGRAR